MSISLEDLGMKNIEEAQRRLKHEKCRITLKGDLFHSVVCCAVPGSRCPVTENYGICQESCFKKCKLNRRKKIVGNI